MMTTNVGSTRCEDELPADYAQQIASIVRDMQSVGVRHNDMMKPGKSDVVVDHHGRASLVDFGWGTIDGKLDLRCNVSGYAFQSGTAHVYGAWDLSNGFRNKNETRHLRVKCHYGNSSAAATAGIAQPAARASRLNISAERPATIESVHERIDGLEKKLDQVLAALHSGGSASA